MQAESCKEKGCLFMLHLYNTKCEFQNCRIVLILASLNQVIFSPEGKELQGIGYSFANLCSHSIVFLYNGIFVCSCQQHTLEQVY